MVHDQVYSNESNHYRTSDLKSRMDGIYHNGFTETERSAIQKRELLTGRKAAFRNV